MRIETFAVQGFKNLVDEVRLEGMGGVVVLHGANDVGKSNVVEAIGACLRLIDLLFLQDKLGSLELDRRNFASVVRMDPRDFYTLGGHGHARFELGVEGVAVPARVEVTWGGDGVRVQPRPDRHDRAAWEALRDSPRFQHIQVDRTEIGDGGSNRDPHDRGQIPADVAMALFDARDSLETAAIQRMDLFRDVMARFRELLGGREINVVYRREEGRALVVLETPDGRLPAYLLGSGAQQVVALIGRVLTCGADIVAIEEPELNLRMDVQERLAEALHFIVADPRGPSQILLTSHSPVFERGGAFFHLERTAEGLRVSRRPGGEASDVTGVLAPGVAPADAPQSYMSTEGALRFNGFAREHLGLPEGGRVFVVRGEPGELRVFSEDRWRERHPLPFAADGDDLG
ncbi:MAG: AAA family ATPase [Myxococcales bacterium]|nr:AAA family ATPase [Myxococcales bacterium]MCB9668434.1 AAA family ATPase [Alphaproteobacteria bacterium]MCB9690672.1 AAA family ATPase [Alphaproteobacteria bacterium]